MPNLFEDFFLGCNGDGCVSKLDGKKYETG